MKKPSGEMPFLEHLEELRFRILRSLIAVIVGVGLGLWLTAHFNLVKVISEPIAPYLLGGKLAIHGVTDQVMVVLKVGATFGLAVAAPFVLYQVWAFMSPALYAKEKKAVIPAMFAGFILFFIGAAIGWLYVVPMGLQFLMTFMPDTFNNFITIDEYFSFVMQVMLAFGISFELPLVMILLAWIGIMSYQKYNAFRRYAILVNAFLGAILSPGTDVFSMIVFTIPLLVLYELGVVGSYIVAKRKKSRDAAIAAVVFLALVGMPHGLRAQVTPPPASSGRPPPAGQDTTHRPVAVPGLDSAAAKRLGLPSKPAVTFPSGDSIAQSMKSRKGFGVTQLLGDSVLLDPDGKKFQVYGKPAGLLRDSLTFTAHVLDYNHATGDLVGNGEPQLFRGNPPKPLIGRVTRINTKNDRVMVNDAFTTFDELGGNWFIRGHFAIDSSFSRVYVAKSEFTSCDLPIPDYHFSASQVKWISQSTIVARPAVLYIRDVPMVWLPFLFQDTKSKRSSGILIPRFGINDIVRPDRSYNRAITNLGYYWAPNDYMDLTTKMDWYANRYISYGAQLRYDWRNRFIRGNLSYQNQVQDNGTSALQLQWSHNQLFNIATTLSLDFNYISNSTVVQNNAIDPLQNTQSILSSANFTKRLRWGNLTIGGKRSQSITDGQTNMQLPTINIQPQSLALGRSITWSPTFSLVNDLQSKIPVLGQLFSNGHIDSVRTLAHSRQTVMNVETPITFGSFTWSNTIALLDKVNTSPVHLIVRRPDTTTADPSDSVTVDIIRSGDFASGVNFNTSMGLPQLLRSTWHLAPSVLISNVLENYPLMYRNAATHGNWVTQGKKLALRVGAAPNFYVLTNGGIGPASRLRYSMSPAITFDYAPKATLATAFARAVQEDGVAVTTEAPAAMTATVGLSQSLQGKGRRAASDTMSAVSTARPVVILNWTTSALSYNFEQAKLAGRSGWTTSAITNSFQSDLVPGFSFQLSHDLWKGQVGTDTAVFSPFLTNVSANLSLTSRTFHGIARLLGLGGRTPPPAPVGVVQPTGVTGPRTGLFGTGPTGMGQSFSSSGLTMNITYSLQRQRPNGGLTQPVIPVDPFGNPPIIVPLSSTSRSNIGLTMGFSPTRYWSVHWQTQYDATLKQFNSQVISLSRDLHDWTATFNFTKNANGNYQLIFSVFLKKLTDIKFDYQQSTIQP